MYLKKNVFVALLVGFVAQLSFAQMKPVKPGNIQPSNFSPADFSPKINPALGAPLTSRSLSALSYFTPRAVQLTSAGTSIKVAVRGAHGMPILIKGTLSMAAQDLPLREQVFAYLEQAKDLMHIEQPAEEFVITKINQDSKGQFHVRMQQQYKGLEVFSGQLILHTEKGVITSLNGRYFPTPEMEGSLLPNISEAAALDAAYADLRKNTHVFQLSAQQKKYTAGQDVQPQLVIMHKDFDGEKETLCWKVKAIPNVLENWDYFIDATTGSVVKKITHTCAVYPDALRNMNTKNETGFGVLPPPGTSNGNDLFGDNQNINIYLQGGTYYLIDASREMFDNGSTIPNDARGAIITVDAQNTHPANGNFDAVYFTNSNNVWNEPKAISAHYNAGICYEYYRQNHGRNSINGQGGNILSFVNVSETDGNGMDNAFWNGQAMFYGNGAQGFNKPLQKSLDVAGHEMTHGVIQSTAGLIYESQAGAINESMADVFGHLMEPNDWQMGEDVVNTAYFPSGALRDLSNPNQGGSSLSDPGWQPAHMNEYQNLPTTPQGDNGGVHVNSGIPNKAFYLFATSVGGTKAGKVYYHALQNNLTANAQFIDLRLAIISSANTLYGATEANAAASAFDQVGILGGSGSSDPTDYTSNPGDDFVIATDADKSALYIYDGSNVYGLTNDPILSRPSITDDGAFILYVAADNTIRILSYDPNTQDYSEDYLESNPQTIWRNVAISKDGSKLAALTTDYDNTIFVYDFNTQFGQYIEVRNSTSQQGVFTNDLQYVDFIEWDFVGEEILFDAYNVLDDDFGNTSDYWDIGLIRVWDNASNTFGDGFVFKIFSGLPENSSVGNPTFSKNSPYIIALDFIEDNNGSIDNSILGVNIQTGDVETIFENAILGYPNYSIDDTGLIFDAHDNDGNQIIAYIGLNSDKITASDNAQVFLNGGKWGVWYGLGQRDLTATPATNMEDLDIGIFPNPTTGHLTVSLKSSEVQEVVITTLDLTGKIIRQQKYQSFVGQNDIGIDLKGLGAGIYVMKIATRDGIALSKVVVE